MRIWDCDPRLLSNRHLLGEHREIHSLMSGGWAAHPESKRFEGRRGLLALRHDALAAAMRWRFGSPDRTSAPISMLLEEENVLRLWLMGTIEWGELMTVLSYPATWLEHGTPWERDAVPYEWYLAHRFDWSWDLVHEFHGADGPPAGRAFYGSRPA